MNPLPITSAGLPDMSESAILSSAVYLLRYSLPANGPASGHDERELNE